MDSLVIAPAIVIKESMHRTPAYAPVGVYLRGSWRSPADGSRCTWRSAVMMRGVWC